MNIFVYADESGVFDRTHNNVFVFGGLIFLGKDERDEGQRRGIGRSRGCKGVVVPLTVIAK